MAQTQEAAPQVGAVYSLQGTLTEACSCNVPGPCWIGEDPDEVEAAIVAWHIDSGQVTGIDVSGRSLRRSRTSPATSWPATGSLSCWSTSTPTPNSVTRWSRSSAASFPRLLADFAQLIGTVKGPRASPSASRSAAALERFIPGIVEAEMEPYRSPLGDVTTLRDSIFSTVPGSPAWVSKATRHRVNLPQYGMSWSTRAATPSRPSGRWSTSHD